MKNLKIHIGCSSFNTKNWSGIFYPEELPRSKWMSLSFHAHEILIAYPRNSPLFIVPPMWQPISAAAMQRCIWEVESIFQVIDVIKLNGQIRT